MRIPGHRYIEALIQKKSDFCITIYLPLHRIGDPQDSLRYKNLVGRAEKKLIEKGARASDVANFLAPEYELAKDADYWKHAGAEGLAVFCCDEVRERFPLPRTFNESVTVGKLFKVKPLIPLFTGDGRYFLLALDKQETRLYMGTRFNITEIGLPAEAPVSLDQTLRYDEYESQLQYHTGSSGGGGSKEAIYHGQGVGTDEQRQNITRFFQQLDRQLYPIFHNENIPVVLAGIDYLTPIYRENDSSGMLIDKSIRTNPDSMSTEELHRQSWELVEPLFIDKQNRAFEKFKRLHGTGQAVSGLDEILAAGEDGRIDTLFTVENAEQWGGYDSETRRAQFTGKEDPEAVDLLDLAVARTLSGRGTVFIRKHEDMPINGNAAAVLRY